MRSDRQVNDLLDSVRRYKLQVLKLEKENQMLHTKLLFMERKYEQLLNSKIKVMQKEIIDSYTEELTAISKSIWKSKENLIINPEENEYTNIIKYISEYYGQTYEDVYSRSRKREYVIPRHVGMWYLFYYFSKSLSLKSIGKVYNGRHHSSVIHAVRAIDDLTVTDKKFKKSLDVLIDKLKGIDYASTPASNIIQNEGEEVLQQA